MKIAMFLIGLLLGGCTVTVFLCCLQLNRVRDYETEIQRLREELAGLEGGGCHKNTGIEGGQ